MRKILIIPLIIISLLIAGCSNTNNIEKVEQPSEKKYITNLIKEKLKDLNYIDEKNVDKLEITNLSVRGFYKNKMNIKYVVFHIDYTCKDNTKICVKNIEELPPNYIEYDYENYLPKIIVLDNYNFVEFKNGLGILANNGFIEETEQYTLKVNDTNREEINKLINKEQKYIKSDKNTYCEKMYKIETKALFIEPNKYTIYCEGEKNIEFTLDKLETDSIQEYMYKNGEMFGKEVTI